MYILCTTMFGLFSFGHCVVCPSSVYAFWLHIWYLQTLLMMATLIFYKWRINLTTGNSWLRSFLVRSNPLSRKSWKEPQALHTISTEKGILRLYDKTSKWKMFAMGILKSYLLSESYVLNRRSLSISRCRSRYEVDIVVSMVSYIWGSTSLMGST